MSRDEVAREAVLELREITERVGALKREGAKVLYELGALLARVEDEGLWRAGGFGSFSDYLGRGVEISETSARRAIAVARHFGPEIAAAYGLDKLSRGLRYLELTGRDERPGDLIATDLKNRGPDGRFVSVPFHEASVRQIDEAIRIELARQRRGRADPDLGALIERLQGALPAPPAGLRAAKRRVEVTRTRAGEVSLTFRQIPLAELRVFAAALAEEGVGEDEG